MSEYTKSQVSEYKNYIISELKKFKKSFNKKHHKKFDKIISNIKKADNPDLLDAYNAEINTLIDKLEFVNNIDKLYEKSNKHSSRS